MAKHTISAKQFESFEAKIQIAASANDGEHKSLNIVTKITFEGEVYSLFKVEYLGCNQLTTTDLDKAIDKYNKF